MADENVVNQSSPALETAAEISVPTEKRRKTPRTAKAEVTQSKASKSTKPSVSRPRRYSDDKRAQKLGDIEARVSEGETLKAAVKGAGISEQTYYQWKRAATVQPNPGTQTAAKTEIASLAELVELEAENERLRSLLAVKLQAENAELRKRLGMD